MCALLLGYGALHTLFYGVLYAPMFADLDFSVVGIGRHDPITLSPSASLIFSQNDKDDIKSLSGKYKRTPKF